MFKKFLDTKCLYDNDSQNLNVRIDYVKKTCCISSINSLKSFLFYNLVIYIFLCCFLTKISWIVINKTVISNIDHCDLYLINILLFQLTSSNLDSKLREDLERMKKIRAHRGLRHYWGLRVRGQHTKTTGRRGRTVGVSKKK